MTNTVVTTGYTGKKPNDILDIVTATNGIVFDIRFSPRSRVAHWSGKQMREFFGDRYKHVNALGNQNFKSGPIKIVNYEEGRETIRESTLTVILLCVCKSPDGCHRTKVADMLRADGFDVTEWGEEEETTALTFGQDEPPEGQLSLFGG